MTGINRFWLYRYFIPVEFIWRSIQWTWRVLYGESSWFVITEEAQFVNRIVFCVVSTSNGAACIPKEKEANKNHNFYRQKKILKPIIKIVAYHLAHFYFNVINCNPYHCFRIILPVSSCIRMSVDFHLLFFCFVTHLITRPSSIWSCSWCICNDDILFDCWLAMFD